MQISVQNCPLCFYIFCFTGFLTKKMQANAKLGLNCDEQKKSMEKNICIKRWGGRKTKTPFNKSKEEVSGTKSCPEAGAWRLCIYYDIEYDHLRNRLVSIPLKRFDFYWLIFISNSLAVIGNCLLFPTAYPRNIYFRSCIFTLLSFLFRFIFKVESISMRLEHTFSVCQTVFRWSHYYFGIDLLLACGIDTLMNITVLLFTWFARNKHKSGVNPFLGAFHSNHRPIGGTCVH